MTCRSDRWRRHATGGAVSLALLLAGPVAATDQSPAAPLHEALVALGRGDGIAAEAALRRAQAAGLPRAAVAARMGEAQLDQGDLRKAREWLGPGEFTPTEAPHGWRMLGRLEIAEGNLPAAGRAFDRALRLTPRDSRLWVDIARLRYLGGEHTGAIAAASHAVELDPANIRALELRGLLVRDSYGQAAALPWFEAGIKLRQDDVALLTEYAATLGELGQTRAMLTVTRRVMALGGGKPRGFLLQATLAARAGQTTLARQLVQRAGPGATARPAGLLLAGLLELEAGNTNLAVELLDRLVRWQPDNQPARLLLARALAAAGQDDELVTRFAAEAAAAGASPYLQTLVARAYEARGERALAAPLLDAAARPAEVPFTLLRPGPPGGRPVEAAVMRVRELVAARNLAGAGAAATQALAARPGSAELRLLAGDVELLRGNFAGALQHYRGVAEVRLSDPLVLRLIVCLQQLGQARAIGPFVARLRTVAPRNPFLLRLDAEFAGDQQQWARAAEALRTATLPGAGRDALLQADLALALARAGKDALARAAGSAASTLQPLAAAGTLAYAYAQVSGPATERAGGQSVAGALLAKARAQGARGGLVDETARRIARPG